MTTELKVKKLIAEHFGVATQDVQLVDPLEKFNIDSLDIVEIVMHLEDTFSIALESPEYKQVRTVKDIVDLTESKLASK